MQSIDIKIARIKAGLKQYEVAAQLGMPQTTLSEIELGKREVSHELSMHIVATITRLQQAKVSQPRIACR